MECHSLFKIKHIRAHQGFSLIELVVSMAILSIIAMIVIPGFDSQMNTSRERSAQDALITAINTARSEAVLRNGVTRLSLSASCTGAGSKCIQLDVGQGLGGTPTYVLLREWPHEGAISYSANATVFYFSSLGFLATADGAQVKTPQAVKVVLGSERSQEYCVTVSGNVVKGGCGQ